MKTCVYTVLLGGYDTLLDQPVADDSAADFICFTDDETLSSDTWQMQVVAPRFPQDLHRSSREFKIRGHEVLQEYDATLCIDASVLLRTSPEEIISNWLAEGHDMAFALHSYRERVIDEFDEVVRLNYDDRVRVHEQLMDYSITYPDVLDARPHWGGMIVRRRGPRVDAAMALWYDHVLRYSRRDQLSLMVALLHGGASFRSVTLDNFASPLHEWPVITGRRIAQGKASLMPSGPLIAELHRAQRRVSELEDELSVLAVDELRARVASFEVQVEQGTIERRVLEQRAADALREAGRDSERLRRYRTVSGAASNLSSVIWQRITRRG